MRFHLLSDWSRNDHEHARIFLTFINGKDYKSTCQNLNKIYHFFRVYILHKNPSKRFMPATYWMLFASSFEWFSGFLCRLGSVQGITLTVKITTLTTIARDRGVLWINQSTNLGWQMPSRSQVFARPFFTSRFIWGHVRRTKSFWDKDGLLVNKNREAKYDS